MNWEDNSLQSDREIAVRVASAVPNRLTSDLPNRPLVDRRDPDASDRLETFFYLIPVIGWIPSLWAIYRQQQDRKQLSVCRLSVLLASIWFTIYLSCNVGADLSGSSTSTALRLLFIDSLATSGYFVSSLWLMMLLWQKKSVRLSGLSELAERTISSTDNN